MIAWLKVIVYGTLGKLVAKLLAPIAVLFVDRKAHPIWGNSQTTDFSYWNVAIRNGAHNAFRKPQVTFEELTNTPDDPSLEKVDGFQWRYRKSHSGKYVSFRCTWGAPRQQGKREFYVGWTMRPLGFEDDTMALTFFQLRPF